MNMRIPALVLVVAASLTPAIPLPPSYRFAEADVIIEEIKQIPRPGPLGFQAFPEIGWPKGEILPGKYRADYRTLGEMQQFGKDHERYVIRWMLFEAIHEMRHVRKDVRIQEAFPRDALSVKGKGIVLGVQQRLGAGAYQLEQSAARMARLGREASLESSPRWRAHYDYAVAAMQAQVLFLYEYNHLLGALRTERVPELRPQDIGWRVAPHKDVQTGEPKVKNLHQELLRTLKRIETEYPGTPWAHLAAAEQKLPRGLVWEAKRE